MKSSGGKIDGYAIQNTRHVKLALAIYEQKTATPGEAARAAVDCYFSMSGKRVSGRTVGRWLKVVKSYGGLTKVPENAFGALKACRHVARPVRDQLRQIDRHARRLAAMSVESNSPRAIELASIARSLEGCFSRLIGDSEVGPLLSIRAQARRLTETSIHRMFRYVPETEAQVLLGGILTRLKAIDVPADLPAKDKR